MFPSRSMCRRIAGLGWFAIALAGTASAGSPNAFRTLVVVNTNSADSLDLGAHYAAAHDIPSHHVCEIAVATNSASLTSNEFLNLIHAPITNHIAGNGLDGRIDFIVLCQDLPTRVDDAEGLSASLFYGFKNAPSFWENGRDCILPAYTSNEFFRSERAFRSADGWNNTNGFIAFQIVASNHPTAKAVADRGAAAQATFPPSSINLHMVGEIERSVREVRYADTQFSFTSLPGLVPDCVLAPYYQSMSGVTNVMGCQDGKARIPSSVATNNVWLDGAYADYLTSYGGRIANRTNSTAQSTVLNWAGIGATASYGNVDEPCNYPEKFPDPLMAFWYARGFTIGEAYAMAVEAPYQGLFAGDPLAAPFAAAPDLTVTSQVPYQIVTGTVPVQVTAAARTNSAPPAALDWHLDGVFQTNLAAVTPTRFNQIGVVVAGHTNTAAVTPSDDTLFEIVAALADDINSDGSAVVSASARGDRLQLIYENYDHAGDNAPVAAFAATGTASSLTLGTGLAATNLHPSVYPARKKLTLYTWTSAGANAGDTITNIVTLTNGVAVTNVLVAAQGEKVTNLLERLRSAILTNTTLQATNGVLYERLAYGVGNVLNDGTLFARTPGPDGAGIQVDYFISAVSNGSGLYTGTSFSSLMDDNPDDVRPRASILFHVRPTNDILNAQVSLDTTALDDGVRTLDFIARDGSAVAAASRLTLPLVVCNSSAQLAVLGTNGAAVADGEDPSTDKGTDFGSRHVGVAVTNLFSIHNNGSADLNISSCTTNGTGATAFLVSGLPAVVAVGGTSNFSITFTPSSSGDFDASLSFDSDAVLPATNLLLAGTGLPPPTLTVESAHGTPDPPVGITTNAYGTVLTNSVAVPAPAGGTQFVCTGWSMAGNAPLSGSATNFEMTVTNNAVLTWLWTTNFWLDTAAGPNGSVDVADSWQPANVTTQITASPSNYYAFTNWSGDSSETNNPLNLLMDAPKTVQANFTALLATNGTPQWWLAQYGWTNNFDAAATNDAEPDGFATWQEYIADTDPTNADSFFPPLDADGSATNLAFTFDPTSTGRQYYVDVTTPLDGAPSWTNITNAAGTGGAWDPELAPPGTGFFFYRGRVTLPP